MIDSPTTRQSRSQVLNCICCESETLNHGTNCLHCQAPLALSRSIHDRGTPPCFVSVLGASGAGKTVYLGLLLDMLSKGSRSLRGLPGSAFSVAVQQQTITALENRRFPDKTPSEADAWRWVHCEISHARKPQRMIDLITPDLAGEAIAIEVDREDSYPTIRSIVGRSAGILVLFDSLRCRDQGREEDLFAMKLVAYIARQKALQGAPNKRKLSVPLSIVFTKADSCSEALESPREFARATMPSLVQSCDRHFEHHAFFAAGAVGSMAVAVDGFGRRMQLPLHIQPHGILEPLEWITTRIM